MRSLLPPGWAALLAGLLLAPAVTAAPAAPVSGQEMTANDHKTLGRALKKYFDELDSPKKLEKARADLQKGLEKVGKKAVGKDGDPIQGVLKLTDDLGVLLTQSYGYKNVRGGKVSGKKISGRGGDIEYALWLPSSYKSSKGGLPLVILVPDTKDGAPFPGDQFLAEYWTESELRDNVALAALTMPQNLDAWGEQFIEDENGARIQGGLSYLMRVFGDVRATVAIDVDRVYLAGRGAGVSVVMKLGSLYPQLFAGVLGRAGDSGDVVWQNFQNLPTFLMGSGAQATAFEEAAKGAGYENVTLKPEAEAEELWTWMQDNPRTSNPTKVTLVPGSPIPNRAYWLQIPPTDVEEGTYVKGEIDRATNTVTIEGVGVRNVILYFNDVLYDLDQPIRVVLNGQAQETAVPRSLDDFLKLSVRGTNDAGRLYVAVRDFDLPE